MTLPPNIKEEIEKATCYVNNDLSYSLVYDIRIIMKEIATQFYQRGIGDRDAIAKAAFEAGRELVICPPTRGYIPKYSEPEDYLASDEYKKLVGEK